MAQEQIIGQNLIVETIENFKRAHSKVGKAEKANFIQHIKDNVKATIRKKPKNITAIQICTNLETAFKDCNKILTTETYRYLTDEKLLPELQKTITDLKDLETTVAKGLERITQVVNGFIQGHPNPQTLVENQKTALFEAITQAIKQTLAEMPENVELDEFRKKVSFVIHPDTIKNSNTIFTPETLIYLEEAGLLGLPQQALETLKDYIPEKPPGFWENVQGWVVAAILTSFALWSLQMVSESTDDYEQAQEARQQLKQVKKALKKDTPMLAFLTSLSAGLDKYPQPIRFIANTLSWGVFNIPLLIGMGCVLLASSIVGSVPQFIQFIITFFLNLITSGKYNALEREEAIKEVWEQRELIGFSAELTLEELKDFLNTQQNTKGAKALEDIITATSTLLSHNAITRTKITLLAAWKSLTQTDENTFGWWYALWPLRLILLIPIIVITFAIQTFRFIVSVATSAITATLIAVKFASLLILNIPRLLFKLPKYLGKAWENRAELASSFGNWLSEKAFTLSSGVLLSLSAVGVAAAIFGLNPMMLGIVAGVSGVLSLILTHDDLDIGNRGFKFGLSLVIFLGAAAMVFFAFGPTLFPSIAEFIPSLPHLLDYLLPFAEPIQAAIAAAGAVGIVLLPTLIAGATGKVVEAATSTAPDEPKTGGGGDGLGWVPNWRNQDPTNTPDPALGDSNAYTANPTGTGGGGIQGTTPDDQAQPFNLNPKNTI